MSVKAFAWKAGACAVTGALGFFVVGPALARVLVGRALATDILADLEGDD